MPRPRLTLPAAEDFCCCGSVLNLLAGFPETAYINGLLVIAWAVMRYAQTAPGKRLSFAEWGHPWRRDGNSDQRSSNPAVFEFLPHSFVGGHTGRLRPRGSCAVGNGSGKTSFAFWAYCWDNTRAWPALEQMFGNIGGYLTLAIVLLALYGAISRPSALGWLLLGWTILALAKTFGLEPIVSAWELLPGIPETSFYRYATPTSICDDHFSVSMHRRITIEPPGSRCIRHDPRHASDRDCRRLHLIRSVFIAEPRGSPVTCGYAPPFPHYGHCSWV